MDKIELLVLHIVPREGSPFPEEMLLSLPYGGRNDLENVYHAIPLWMRTHEQVALLREKMIEMAIARSWQPVHVRQEGTQMIITSGELDALAALHAGESVIPCIYDVPPEQPPASSLQEGREVAPAPAPLGTGRSLEHEIADFAGWLHARPQPPGFRLAAAASYCRGELAQSLSAEEVWTILFGDRYSRMPTGWRPTPGHLWKASIKELARWAKTSEYTIKSLLKVDELPASIRRGAEGLSFRALRTISHLKGEDRQRMVVQVLKRRPLSARQLEMLVSLCNKGMAVEQALIQIDSFERSKMGPVGKAALLLLQALPGIKRGKQHLMPEEAEVLRMLGAELVKAFPDTGGPSRYISKDKTKRRRSKNFKIENQKNKRV